ncbi:hypothetical protein CR205_11795 [Alteribacter lacisalsi]|uniref:DUF624 domain-containing protein n=1 Tax=Alteribacter lacisalsi TaxID=2045244 RepID=A0A2W0H8J3_9BACI|nr:DUF624 domain-containing protein [Alteribacter lacisalsi]PYZ96400.1 hypothetical protein CR205_11795 [Alteribacter lacisalsi]
MSGNAVVDRIMTGLEILVKVFVINGLWILFTALGLVVFGIFPATVALLAVVRKWIMGESDVPIFKTFAGSYKKEFVKANLYGLMIVLYGWVLYVNYQYMLLADGLLQLVMVIGLIITTSLFLLTVSFLFPSLVHFKLSFVEYLKFSFLLGVTRFYLPVLAGIGLTIVYHSVLFYPGVLVWFVPSLTGLILMSTAYQAFRKLPEAQV